jgi:hypothetical protein
MSPNPTVARTVTTKDRVSVRFSGPVKAVASVAASVW